EQTPMCELFAMTCSKPATVTYSLNEFALHGGSKYKNNSGWGIAYFRDRDALTIKEPEPASDSPWVDFIANQGVESDCVIAHVRLATVGQPSLENTHPFRRALGRRTHVFAHNGTLHGLHDQQDLAELDRKPIGSTDSELSFCILLERMNSVWGDGSEIPDVKQRLDVFAEFASEMAEYGSSNFLYSDGDALFVHGHRRIYEENGGFSEPRAPGLSMRNCVACQQGPEWDVAGCHISMGHQKTMLFASVPLDDVGWEPLPERTAIAASLGEEVARVQT
ncbi:MAG: class II glutamine amidotransferase, partial [Rhizobiaceae bacterium]